MAVGTDHQLLDTVRRRLRHPVGWLAVALHLSRLAPPAPRPHHRRIARVLMQDVARRHDGEVFTLGHGDIVLLCRDGEPAAAGGPVLRVARPRALPEVLGRLLHADAPDPTSLVSLWSLDSDGDALLRYTMAAVAASPLVAVMASEPEAQLRSARSIAGALDTVHVTDLLRRQTAVVMTAEGMRPLFREIRFSMAALEARLAMPAAADADPFLFRYLAERMDRRMLDLLRQAIGSGEALDVAAAGAPALHVNLTLAGMKSEEFARLAAACMGRRPALGVEISVLEACADPNRFEAGRQALAKLGMTLVLDGVSHLTTQIADVAALRPDLLKLAWSPQLAQAEPAVAAAQERLIGDLGPERVVLHHAETEAALKWGLARGIRRFQGRHIDAMLGAARITSCQASGACSLRQCVERGASGDRAGRKLCRNQPLLETEAPVAARTAPAPREGTPGRVDA